MKQISKAILARRWAVTVLQILFGALIIGTWQLLTSTGVVKTFALTPPWQVATLVGSWFRSGSIWINIGATLEVASMGFAIGVLVGTSIGLLAGTVPIIRYYTSPFLGFFNSIPPLIVIPIFILWLGFGNEPQVIIVAISMIFLIAATVESGVNEIQGVLVQNARALGASWPQMVRTVYLPGVAIWIVSVGRQCVGHAIVGACVAEFFGAKVGLGYLIEYALNTFDTRQIYAAIVVTSGVALCFDFILRRVDRRISRYLPAR